MDCQPTAQCILKLVTSLGPSKCCEMLSDLGTRCFKAGHIQYFSPSKTKCHWIICTILFAEINFILCKWLWVIFKRLLCIRPWDWCSIYCLQMCSVPPSGDSLEPALCLPPSPQREPWEVLGKTQFRPNRKAKDSWQLLQVRFRNWSPWYQSPRPHPKPVLTSCEGNSHTQPQTLTIFPVRHRYKLCAHKFLNFIKLYCCLEVKTNLAKLLCIPDPELSMAPP